MLYEITLTTPDHEGTLQVLIERVRRYEVNILDVRLAPIARQVAHAMLNSEIYDFTPCTAVASLMFVKSRALLPWQNPLEEPDLDDIDIVQDEEEPTRVRERLLALYEIFREAAEHFRERGIRMREKLRASQTRGQDVPGIFDEIAFVDEVSAFDILLVMNQVLRRAEQDNTYHVKVTDTYLLNKRIAEVFEFLTKRMGNDARFTEIVSKNTPKTDAVLTFLAIIYLVSRGKIVARQKLPYGDIIMSTKSVDEAKANTQ